MFTYIFYGVVIPERLGLTLSPVSGHVKFPDVEFDLGVTLSIHQSQISVAAHSDTEVKDIATLRNCIDTIARSLVDAYGYAARKGLDMEIRLAVCANNGLSPEFEYRTGSNFSWTEETEKKYEEVAEVLFSVGSNSASITDPLRRALGDVGRAYRMPHDTGLFAYRAIESLRQHFVNSEDKEKTRAKKSWISMRECLRIDQALTTKLEDFSKYQRHGEAKHLSGSERSDVIKTARQVIDRFILHAKNGCHPLSGQYPILKSD